MGVFNAAENQVLITPVTSYYEGKAIRTAQKQAEADVEFSNLQAEAIRQEIKMAPAKERKALKLDDLQIEKAELAIQDARGKFGDAELQRRADAYWPILDAATKISEAGNSKAGIAFVNEHLPKAAKALGPEVWAEFDESRGPDKDLSADEIFCIGLGIETFRRIVEDPGYTLVEGAQRRDINTNALLAENPKDASGGAIETAESSLILRSVVGGFGGLLDENGKIIGLKPNIAREAQKVGAEAEKIYIAAGGKIGQQTAADIARDQYDRGLFGGKRDSAYKKALSEEVVHITTDEEFENLADGQEFIGPDGIRRIK